MKRLTVVMATVLLAACSGSPTPAIDGAAPPGDAAGTRDVASSDAPAPGDAATASDAAHPTDSGPAPVTGVSQVFAAEYVTTFLQNGHMYCVGGLLYRRGAGSHPPAAQYPPSEVDVPSEGHIVTGAGGLHFTIAADTDGHVWEWGDIAANPDLANHNSPIELTNADGTPFVLPGGVASMSANGATSAAVAGDGSVWIWDDTSHGFSGDGTGGNAATLHPVRVALPAGVHATRIVLGGAAIALDDMGRIWSWGGQVMEDLGTQSTDFNSPHQLAQTGTGAAMPAAVDIASGGPYSYALTASGDLYVWGIYLEIAGHCPGSGWCPSARPVLANEVVAAATAGGAHVVHIRASSGGSYAVLSDGTLWGWGTDGQGLVGDGHEPDYATTMVPYSWDWGKDDMLVTRAVRIAPSVSSFVDVFSGTADVFYVYALTSDGRLFSWGRNKTADLGNGVEPMNSQESATYPNSWDVTVPTAVDPMHATDHPTTSPVCTSNPSASSCWCAGGPPPAPQSC